MAENNNDLNQIQRENWATRAGFILAAAGSAVGLGNIWRFPYVTGTNGGAAFIVIYLIAILIIGYPVMITEMVLGRKAKRNPVGVFKELAPNTPWWLVGALGVFTGFVILSYYSVVAGWSLAYIFRAIMGQFVPETDFVDLFVGQISGFGGALFWHAVFMVLTILVISMGVVRGIQRAVRWLMPILAVLLGILVIRSVTLSGAMEGITFYLRPDFSEITAETFREAIAQAFFTLSLGMGAIITYGSYLSDEEEIGENAASVVGLDTLIAIVAGLAIFPAVFALGFDPASGPGLTFMTLPAVFAEMPLGGLFGFLFFLLLSIAALTSAISLLEVVVAYMVDERDWERPKASWLMGVIILIVGIPPILGYGAWEGFSFLGMDVLDTYDWFANSLFLPIGGLLTVIFAGYVYGARQMTEEANRVRGRITVGGWYGALIRYIVPLAIIIILVASLWETFS